LPVPIVTGVAGPGRGGWQGAAEHDRAWDRGEVQPRIRGLPPVRAAVILVAVVLTEEGADAVAAEISDAVVADPGEDRRVG
jgi:hypothetical protein